jgi:hypothetical protein
LFHDDSSLASTPLSHQSTPLSHQTPLSRLRHRYVSFYLFYFPQIARIYAEYFPVHKTGHCGM